MAGGRFESYRRGRAAAATALPGLWKQDPKSAALAYVRRDRDPATRELYMTAIPATEEAAPGEGDLTYTNAFAACLGPYIVTRYHLHCAAEGSFLLRMERYLQSGTLPRTDWRSHWEVRRIDLSREQARQLFQVVWWMSRVRSLQYKFSGTSSSSFAGDETSAVAFRVKGKSVQPRGSLRSGIRAGGLYPTTFSRLTAQLLDQDVADWLGEPWKAQAMPVRLAENNGLTIPQTAEARARIKEEMAGVLRLFGEGKVSAPLAEQAVLAVGEENWRDLRGAVERAREVLPPLFPFEKRLAEIEEQLKPWKEKLGKEAGEWASWGRENRRHAGHRKAGAPRAIEPLGGSAAAGEN